MCDMPFELAFVTKFCNEKLTLETAFQPALPKLEFTFLFV